MRNSFFSSFCAPLLLMAVSLQQSNSVFAADKLSTDKLGTSHPDIDYHHKRITRMMGEMHFHQHHIFPSTEEHLRDYHADRHILQQATAKHAETVKLWSAKLSPVAPVVASRGWFSWGSSKASPTSPAASPAGKSSILEDSFIHVDSASVASRPPRPVPPATANSNPFRFNDGEFLMFPLSGGGGRGLIELVCLTKLYKETNTPLVNYADFIGGTSFGGLAALGLSITDEQGSPLFVEPDMESYFRAHFGEIFPDKNRTNYVMKLWNEATSLVYTMYDAKPYETLLKNTFKERTMADSATNVMALAVDTATDKPVLLSNFLHGASLASDTARVTSAAPGYIGSFDMPNVGRLVDGGLYHNDPSLDMLWQLRDLAIKNNRGFSLDKVTALSFGTGIRPVNPIPANGGLLRVAAPVIEACIRSQEAGTEMTMRSLLSPDKYKRLNPKLEWAIPLDQMTPEIASALTTAAETQFGIIEEFAASEVIRKRLEIVGGTR